VLAQPSAGAGRLPLTDVKTFKDLVRFPNIVDELHVIPVRDLAPEGRDANPPTPLVFETGGTAGAPTPMIAMPDCDEQVTRRWAVSWRRRRVQQPPALLGPFMVSLYHRSVWEHP
jgi:hypothetical protein